MKNKHVLQTSPTSKPAKTPAVGRFQVFQQTRAGIYTLSFKTDSDAEAVETFMLQAPAFEGGEIRLLDRDGQRMIAFVKWTMEATEIGLPVFHRENVFHDWHLALIACGVQRQSQMRAAVELIAGAEA
jgi:glycogen synthase